VADYKKIGRCRQGVLWGAADCGDFLKGSSTRHELQVTSEYHIALIEECGGREFFKSRRFYIVRDIHQVENAGFLKFLLF